MLSLNELTDIVFMTAVVGFIFMDIFKMPRENYDPLIHYSAGFNWSNFFFACLIVAPAIILHELAHKLIALSFGLQATFQAAYIFLGIGLLMKFMRFGFIFFVPAYVSISGRAAPMAFSLVALAGPSINMVLWLSTSLAIKKRLFDKKYNSALFLMSRINMFLFIFNMLPIPGFDGYKFLSGMLSAFV